ncbi:IclR family transcriptional regulator [Sphingomonas aerophila]|jgi:DNA-binding IclR family transcriptional regulator|uniref:DNA-binding IclR family transcriptional regulator n=1 Tax=Sphingomonas aerophila TaxID=1344948 RepID=A0A7W9EXM7_9SPHN|nr:IclR family transcriptional regulator [Sphingomonas aerophila]MBB5716723.1 DNA-binding IclR family transcriptional regulator [Sphingomonas aerophila]
MRNAPSNPDLVARKVAGASVEGEAKASTGSQTLLRGLDVIEAMGDGPVTLPDLAVRLGLTRSTTHRLATALIERRYLTFTPRLGYQFGPKLLELGFLAQRQTDIVQVARPHLEELAATTEDTVHLGVLDGERALYLDKIAGRRRVDIRSRVGDRHPLTSTGLGKALLIDHAPENWAVLFAQDQAAGAPAMDYAVWEGRMRAYAQSGHSFDLEENEDLIRCVAAPIRGAGGAIVAAISVSSAAQYMSDDRMADLAQDVRDAAGAVSRELGWSG